MRIETEVTPNPATLKFLPGVSVCDQGSVDFPNAATAAISPLAAQLFALGHVERVHYGADFISVTRRPRSPEWSELRIDVLSIIMDHLISGEPLMLGDMAEVETFDDPRDARTVARIRQLIDEQVRPAVARDGGDIIYRGFQDGIVYLHMQGSCAGCPSSQLTLKGGVEKLLRQKVPEVAEVRTI